MPASLPPALTGSQSFIELNNLIETLAEGIEIEPGTDGVGIAINTELRPIGFKHSFSEQRFLNRVYDPHQTLLKACSNKQRNIHNLLDLTGGWGVDSFLLAHHGRNVTTLEQNRLIYAIAAYSLHCAGTITQLANTVERIKLLNIAAQAFLTDHCAPAEFDCIYLDPMFPAHKSSAKPAKEMQILQQLTGNIEIEQCFNIAMAKAGNRVVVKQPAKAAAFSELNPDMVYREKTIRFDVFLTHQNQKSPGSGVSQRRAS